MSTSIPPVNATIALPSAPSPPSGADAQAFESCFAEAARETGSRGECSGPKVADRRSDGSGSGPNDTPAKDKDSDGSARDSKHRVGGPKRPGSARDEDSAAAPQLLSAHMLVAPWLAPPIASSTLTAPTPDTRSGWSQISAHVERLSIESGPQGIHGRAAAMFTLSGELLTDTSVSLTRTGNGWMLRIQTSDPLLQADAERHEAALRKRFAERGLGELVVEQV
jgi:hypothetical protein